MKAKKNNYHVYAYFNDEDFGLACTIVGSYPTRTIARKTANALDQSRYKDVVKYTVSSSKRNSRKHLCEGRTKKWLSYLDKVYKV